MPPKKRKELETDGGASMSSPFNSYAASRRVAPDVTLFVGPEREELRAFSQCLSLSSDFFEALLCGEWAESQSRTVDLPDVDVGAMQMLLEYITPGTELRLGKTNVFVLLPLFHKFQMSSCLRSVDTLLVAQTGFGDAATYLQAACDYQLPKTRSDSIKRIIQNNKFAHHLASLEPLACDDKYAEVMAELWPHIRDVTLSKAQRDAGVLEHVPPPGACEYLWTALVNSGCRGRALQDVPSLCFDSLPMRYFKAADHDSDDSDDEGRDDTMYSDRWLKRKIAIKINQVLPDHVVVPNHDPEDPFIHT